MHIFFWPAPKILDGPWNLREGLRYICLHRPPIKYLPIPPRGTLGSSLSELHKPSQIRLHYHSTAAHPQAFLETKGRSEAFSGLTPVVLIALSDLLFVSWLEIAYFFQIVFLTYALYAHYPDVIDYVTEEPLPKNIR
jgi:hypothetical protein